jgi:site-specific recombinase XerD
MCRGGWSICWPGTATRMPATSTGALQQFFRWLAEEEQIPDPMARLRAPKVAGKLVPVFTSGELSALERTCQGRAFAQRRDAAVIAVLKASGIRAGELAGIHYDPDDARHDTVSVPGSAARHRNCLVPAPQGRHQARTRKHPGKRPPDPDSGMHRR